MAWAFFAGCILAIPICAWHGRFGAAAALVVVAAWGTLLIVAGPSTWGPVMGTLGMAGAWGVWKTTP
jgi:hypothetical protein